VIRRTGLPRVLAAVALGACLLGGCGGSSGGGSTGSGSTGGGSTGSSAERTRLTRQLAAQLGPLPADLSSCVVHEAQRLPIGQLRDLGSRGANLPPGARAAGAHLLTGCIQQGKGVPALRSLIAQRVTAAMPGTLPASFRTCVENKARGLSVGQLSELISISLISGQSAERSAGEQLGRKLGIQCLAQPGVLAALRGLFLRPLQRLALSSRYSHAFTQCVLHKAQQISSARLRQFALHPASAQSLGHALGEGYARQCIAEGAKP
jgi:hypothetical protein